MKRVQRIAVDACKLVHVPHHVQKVQSVSRTYVAMLVLQELQVSCRFRSIWEALFVFAASCVHFDASMFDNTI